MGFLVRIRFIILCGVLCLPLFAYTADIEPDPVEQVTETPISLDFQDAPISVILQALADYQQLNLVVMDSVKGKLSIRLNQVSWQQALSAILKAGQLDAELDGNVMVVIPRQEKEAQSQRDKQLQEQQTEDLPLTTFKYRVHYADVNELAKLLNGQKGHFLTDRGNIVADVRTNIIIVRDIASAIPAIKAFLQEIDSPQPQVLLTAHIVTISQENLQELGVRWGWGGESLSEGMSINSQFNVGLAAGSPAGQIGFQLARINGRLLGLELSAMEAESSVDIIASPRLMTVNRQTASIKQGTEIPYEVSSGASGATSIEFKQAVLGLEVTPQIFPGGQLELALQISQNMPGKGLKKGDGSEILTIDTQEIKTQVSVVDGETIVLGGIFQQNRLSGKERVPLLGDIPVLGALFQRNSQKQSKRELVIFITPTIITTPAIVSTGKSLNG
ncbi:DNA uptake porin HofQ [Jinshanibacter sp. LJY008]|uniref:DNA uptake porin HofQ n=1 Tax=Limnobaculum eriocheiris TaxID=2897391 RepID=A0A9X1MXR0_9GAMM|nr:DNA uptake porin HofQ [Limnobaculum eriocheiris]MCD1126120.1 DNA uptake porin HofQ [Limnobaculum eriocheiris]